MKCPFQKVIERTETKTIVRFAECHGKECPYYGKAEWKMITNGGTRILEKEYRPFCRKAGRDDVET